MHCRSASVDRAPCRKWLPHEQVQRLDGQLARWARGLGAVRLQLGGALEAFGKQGGHHELGFSSFGAYALERCNRSGRWAADSRALARRLAGLPLLRAAVQKGELGWSAAELLARDGDASVEQQRELLELARGHSVRQLRGLLEARRNRGEANEVEGVAMAEASEGRSGPKGMGGDEQVRRRTLTITMSREDSWFFEATKMLLEYLGAGLSDNDKLEALLAEAMSSLLGAEPPDRLVQVGSASEPALSLDELLDCAPFASVERAEQHRQWLDALKNWREQGEQLCEGRLAGFDLGASSAVEAEHDETELPVEPSKLDALIGELSQKLGRRDLELGGGLKKLCDGNGWRRLGYGSLAQYCRERLGLSVSSVKAKMTLSRRAGRLPQLGEALARGVVGFEAAMLIGRVAGKETAEAWIARAAERTYKHFHQDVQVAELWGRLSGRGERGELSPPDGELVQAMQQLESDIVSGRLMRGFAQSGAGERESDEQRGEGEEERAENGGARGQMSGTWGGPAATVSVRLRVTDEVVRTWHALRLLYCGPPLRALAGRGPGAGRLKRAGRPSFVAYLCTAVWRSWQHTLGSSVAFAHIYERERYQCASPVCFKRDVTPHHVRFRSQGGDDAEHNVLGVCTWCHLEGIHGGRLRVRGRAPDRLRWSLGRGGRTEVQGRRLVRRSN